MITIDGRILALGVLAIAGGCIAGYIAFSKDNPAMPFYMQAQDDTRQAQQDLWKDMNDGEEIKQAEEAPAAKPAQQQASQTDFTLRGSDLSEEQTAQQEQPPQDAVNLNDADIANIEPAAGESDASCQFNQFMNKTMDKDIGDRFKKIGRPYRVLAPGTIYTQDYSADRVNINIDEKGIILDIWCG